MEPNKRGSNDNDLFRDPDVGPIELVREGMNVVDATGEHVGTVEFVKMGDPQAATIGADQSGEGGFIQDIAEAFGFEQEPDLSPAPQARLMRVGFIKVDGGGLADTDRYVMSDRIGAVSGDTVRLLVSKDNAFQEE